MFEEARSNIQKTTRRGVALYFGTINLAGETVTNPTKIIRGIERRGEKVLKQIENNNRQVRRNVTLLQKRTSETASSVRGTARATVGLATSVAGDIEAAAPSRSTRKRPTSRRRSTSTRSGSTTRSGGRSNAAVARQRSQAAEKAVRTRALNVRKAEVKQASTAAKARVTRAANEDKSTLEKAQERVQHGFQQVGQQLENVGERVERAVEQVAS